MKSLSNRFVPNVVVATKRLSGEISTNARKKKGRSPYGARPEIVMCGELI